MDRIVTSLDPPQKKYGFFFVVRRAVLGWLGEPKNKFQIYRPINATGRTILSIAGDIAGGISENRFRAITFDWSDLRT